MSTTEDIRWFKTSFGDEINTRLAGTPYTLDFLTAIACQETGPTWSLLRRKNLPLPRLLELCVGDTIDNNGAKGRQAFPKTRAELEAAPRGPEMFALAHQALVDMAQFDKGYEKIALNKNKFCHGYGLFQLDLQFFKQDPDYFLLKRYAIFAETLGKAVAELRAAQKRNGWQGKTALTDLEMAGIGIAYNAGRYRPEKGLKQGHFNGEKFYGEALFDFLRLSKTVAATPGQTPALPTPAPGQAVVAAPTPVSASGSLFEVDVRETPLRLRSEPRIDPQHPKANIIAALPDGQVVQATGSRKTNGFLEVEASLLGAHFRGWASADFLKAVPQAAPIIVLEPAPTMPTTGIIAVTMPRKPGSLTRRSDPAGAHSLNEPNAPGRKGASAETLRTELAAIVAWLAVDKAAHQRYQPTAKSTFCNIYAHDYCHLAGVYLPRVWWTPGAIEKLAGGQTVAPLYGQTIDEQRANDLFRWLRDFGPRFGWRRTSTATKLQLEANQGAIGLIVARRKDDGRSGHITVVVPETDSFRARRDAAGAVTAPLQSQAGTSNFQRGNGQTGWWSGDQFAESAFWLHS